MKVISLHVAPETYQEFKMLAERKGQPVAALIREAMELFLEERKSTRSIFEIPTHHGGRVLKGWTRSELLEEMLD